MAQGDVSWGSGDRVVGYIKDISNGARLSLNHPPHNNYVLGILPRELKLHNGRTTIKIVQRLKSLKLGCMHFKRAIFELIKTRRNPLHMHVGLIITTIASSLQ